MVHQQGTKMVGHGWRGAGVLKRRRCLIWQADHLRHRWPLSLRGRSFVRQNFNLSLPAVETAAHGHTAATRNADRRRVSLRASGRRASCANPTASSCVASPGAQCPALFSHLESKHVDSGFHPGAAAVTPGDVAPGATAPNPLVRSSLVKREVSSDEGEGEGAAVIVDGYSSSSTSDDTSTTAKQQPSAAKGTVLQQRQQQQHELVFDKDDDAACEDLLLDILSGNGEERDGDDGFLSLLADDIIVNPSSESAPESLESLNGFVKREIEF